MLFERAGRIPKRIERASSIELQRSISVATKPDFASQRGARCDSLFFSYYFEANPLGTGQMQYYPQERRLLWLTFYPFLFYEGQQKALESMKRHHVGTIATFESVLEAIKLYPDLTGDDTIHHSENPTPERRSQLERQNILDFTTPMRLTDYIQRFIEYGQGRTQDGMERNLNFRNPFI